MYRARSSLDQVKPFLKKYIPPVPLNGMPLQVEASLEEQDRGRNNNQKIDSEARNKPP